MNKNISKSEIRKEIKQKRLALSEAYVTGCGRLVYEKLKDMEAYKSSDTILIYVSCKHELDTYYTIEKSLELGKKIAVPKVISNEMEFFYITDTSQLSQGYFGIMEPETSNKYRITDLSVDSRVLMIMPGVAFDKQNNRIGYGGGFYDRYLEKHKEIYKKIAFSYDFQIVDYHIPTEEYDIKPDEIICV